MTDKFKPGDVVTVNGSFDTWIIEKRDDSLTGIEAYRLATTGDTYFAWYPARSIALYSSAPVEDWAAMRFAVESSHMLPEFQEKMLSLIEKAETNV